jgi:Leucine-rich repeat (LRR) protein
MRILVLLSVLFVLKAGAQIKFDLELLQSPSRHGPEVVAAMNILEVTEFKKEIGGNCQLIRNGLRSSKYVNASDWLVLSDSVEPYRIDIVYSKYPIRKGEYKEIYPLLFNRLKNLFAIDPMLNDKHLEWNIILQTHCVSDDQVDSLFHGAVIWYKTKEQIDTENIVPDSVESVSDDDVGINYNSFQDLTKSVEFILESDLIPDSLKMLLKGRPIGEQTELIREFLEEEIKNQPDILLTKTDTVKQKKYTMELNAFLEKYKVRDHVVERVLDRHPEWKNILVVNDWTGSMYGYGAQVLRWHVMNFEKSGITSLTLFNDGDNKVKKKIGETGGIYSEKADNVAKLLKLFHLVMMKGGGGDGQENDIEGILNAMEEYPDHSEIVLIADNNACVRDIELASRIGKPVKVILCGYNEKTGVNPDYVYLAKITGGGLYTLENDIEDLLVSLDGPGNQMLNNDKRFKIGSFGCRSIYDATDAKAVFSKYSKANRHRRKVRKLVLENNGLSFVPRGIYKMKKLRYLDLSNNNIAKLSSKIADLKYLQNLDLSENKMNKLPSDINKIYYLEHLDLSHNKFTVLSKVVLSMKSLKTLNLSNNQISSIDKINLLKRLEKLDLSHNNIKELPRSFSQFKKLKVLDLSNNDLETFPVSILNLTKLEELNLENNQLSRMPSQIIRMKHLKTLKLKGNTFSEEEKQKLKEALPTTTIYFD